MGEFGAPTLLELTEGNTDRGVTREPWSGPARSKNLCMYGISMRENREIPCPPGWLISRRAAQGRPKPHA
jgi:hypothetical protein